MKNVALAGLVSFGALLAACSSGGHSSGFDPAQETNGTDPNASGGTGSDSSGNNPGLGKGGGADSGTPSGAHCAFQDSTDHDGDGYSFADGDCNDCDVNANPGAYDVAGNKVDEDCNGTPDDEPTGCDTGLTVGSTAAMDAAKAIGLCRTATAGATGKAKTWGVISATYMLPDGATDKEPKGHGILASLGVNNPKDGKAMLSLSSGNAQGSSPTLNKNYTSGAPAGYPKESPACPGVKTGQPHDGEALELKIRVPTNAKSFSYQENFFTSEFPIFICSQYNDFFVAMLTPQVPGLPDANIAFDQNNNPISVNNSLLQVCKSQSAGGKTFPCPLGDSTLSGTGFTGNAATGWLQTQAPAKPGDEITIRFAIWDSGDGALDSTVLIDKWQWSADAATAASTAPAPK
jgi:hypothetical protein